jgi:ribonucleoside-diphosphate reductase alpha chain
MDDTDAPSNGGNGHSNGEGNGNGSNGDQHQLPPQTSRPDQGESKPATSALTDTPPVVPARMGADLELGPACDQCGGMMQRTGSCYTCSSCGNNTGCG